ncbi:MAG: GyrI-like domain-containing protein [Actinomycetota bacterium]
MALDVMIALPPEATAEELESQLAIARARLDPAFAPGLRTELFTEGPCAQLMHIGPYAEERATIERLHAGIAAAGLHPVGRHHELYMGDPRRSAPERLRTILRQAVG